MKICLGLLLIAASTYAQTIVPKTIVFTGTKIASADLLVQSGLTPGKPLTKDDIEAAMHKLDDTGLFSNIQYSTGPGTLTFALEPMAAKNLQRAEYTNFVWYTKPELQAALHAKLPLFTGTIPIEGDLTGKVERALEAILKERGIDATVKGQGMAGGRVDFSVITPQVLVGELNVAPVDFKSDPILIAISKGISGSEYIDAISPLQVRENLGAGLKEIGYFDETVGPIGHGQPTIAAGKVLVDLTGTAAPGPLYTVGKVTFPAKAGTISDKDYEADQQVKPGGRPSPSLAKNTELRLVEVFHNHGFLDARLTADSSVDRTTHTVDYAYAMLPGETYRMRNLVFAAGMSADQESQLTQRWKLPKGNTYDGRLVVQSVGAPALKTICGTRPATYTLVPDRAAHEVDVALTCGPARR